MATKKIVVKKKATPRGIRRNAVKSGTKRLMAFDAYVLCGTYRAAELYLKKEKGISVSYRTINKWVNEEMERRKTPVLEEIRKNELERIENLFQRHYEKARQGNWKSIQTVFRCMDRKAKLLGLDAPQQIQTDNKSVNYTIDGVDTDEVK